MKLEDFLKRNYGYDPEIKNSIKTYINQWKSWYKGSVRSFHNYFIYNGQRKVNKKRFTMNMAKEISEDWSDILWSEKCKISMKDDLSNEDFETISNELDLYSLINQSIEKSGALGTCSTVTSVYDLLEHEDEMYLDVSEAKTRVDVVDIDNIYPLSWSNSKIPECAFASVEYKNGIKYVICSVHQLNEQGNYVIKNHLFKDINGGLIEIIDEGNIIREFDTKSNIKWFSIFKPLLTNNLFDNSPFGIPHYANAIDNMKAVDIDFDALKNESKDNKKRTFVRSDMLSYDDGTQRMVFDPNDTDVYVLPKGATKDDLIQSDTQDLRNDKLIASLNTNLNILGNKVGFGENHYHFDGKNLSTATAVISSNSKLFRRKKKLEIGYESAIYDLVKSICYASTQFGKYNIKTENMVIQFDDSIIEDKETESKRADREVARGVLSKVEYREKIFGETEEIAKKKISEINENEPDLNTLLNGKPKTLLNTNKTSQKEDKVSKKKDK